MDRMEMRMANRMIEVTPFNVYPAKGGYAESVGGKERNGGQSCD